MALLDTVTGGAASTATADEQAALAALQGLQAPTQQQLTLPELQKYAAAQNMSPAQMQAFIQQQNALNGPINQTGTSAQEQAISQLAGVANAGARGTPQEQAQIAQALEQSNQNLQGQRGSIDQQAEARGISPGLLQAALGQQNAGQDAQNANAAALQAQSQAYQTAVNAMGQGATAGQNLQGQQNTQANTVGAAQNAMQQFNAANQQAAGAANAGYQQQANSTNTAAQNQVQQANTGLGNQRTLYNAQVPETVFNNTLNKAQGIANQENAGANVATQQGQQSAGLAGGLLGTAGTVIGGMYGGPAGAAIGNKVGTSIGGNDASGGQANAAYGGMVQPSEEGCAKGGIIPYLKGGMVPGHAQLPGNSPKNDTVHIRVSPGEAVIPRTNVAQNPVDTMRLLAGRPGAVPQPGEPGPGVPPAPAGMSAPHHPQDVAALLAAMKHLRGGGQ